MIPESIRRGRACQDPVDLAAFRLASVQLMTLDTFIELVWRNGRMEGADETDLASNGKLIHADSATDEQKLDFDLHATVAQQASGPQQSDRSQPMPNLIENQMVNEEVNDRQEKRARKEAAIELAYLKAKKDLESEYGPSALKDAQQPPNTGQRQGKSSGRQTRASLASARSKDLLSGFGMSKKRAKEAKALSRSEINSFVSTENEII